MNTSFRFARVGVVPLLLVALSAVSPVVAQDLEFATPLALSAESAAPQLERHVFIGDDDTIAFAAGELGRERIVKAAPYCADAEQESVQTLADGNRIVRKQSTRLCRDGEGRTRQEVDRSGHRIVYLRDPVSHENWVLDLQRKSARRLGNLVAPHDTSAWREYGDKMREWAKGLHERVSKDGAPPAPVPPVPPTPPTPPMAGTAPVVVTQDEREVRDADGKLQKEVQVRVLRFEGPHGPMAMPGMPGVIAPLPPGVAMCAQIGAPRGPGVASSLGTKDIEGVKANGERTTWTIEAGKVGNEKPIVVTRDVWTSPDLMVTMQTRDADPQVGETTYRLTNLKRGEPDASLMRVPPDFTVIKAPITPVVPHGPVAPPSPKAPSAPGAKG